MTNCEGCLNNKKNREQKNVSTNDENSENSIFFFLNGDDNDFGGSNNLSIDKLSELDLNKTHNLDINSESVNHVNGWLFGFVENFYSYSYDASYFIFKCVSYLDGLFTIDKRYIYAATHH